MKSSLLLIFLLLYFLGAEAQKKPLDHSVYDNWQRIGERMISPDGHWVVYTVEPQEGDNELIIQSVDGVYKKSVARGYNATITRDSRFVIFKIKPFYKDSRQARIKKLKPEEFPKDSLGLVEMGKEDVIKKPMVKSFKLPADGFGWMAYHMDSLKASADLATTLVLRDLFNGNEKNYPRVSEYLFSKNGRKLVIEQAKDPKDSLSKASVSVIDLGSMTVKRIADRGNDFRAYSFSEDGKQLAFVAERDASPKDLQKFYGVWLYNEGEDSAVKIVDKHTQGMRIGMTVSEFGILSFSKSGKRLLFSTGPIQPIRDTTLVEIDIPKLDIWHYNDDYLQTVQNYPARLREAQQQNYLAAYDLLDSSMKQLGSREVPLVIRTQEGDGDIFIGVSDFGRRIASQWEGVTRKDIFAINVKTGDKKLIRENLHGQAYPSSTGKYIMFYDRKTRNYFVWDGDTVRNISARIKVPLWNQEAEVPDDPQAYGPMRWLENDEAVFVYDKYSIWKLDPRGKVEPKLVLDGRPTKKTYRYVQVNPEEQFLEAGKPWIFRVFNNTTKESGYLETVYSPELRKISITGPVSPETDMNVSQLQMSRSRSAYLYSLESFTAPPDLYTRYHDKDDWKASRLTSINPQQKNYYWGTAELFKWKAFDGKESAGIVYKPENFDPKKKYPMIAYFYEDLSDNLHSYHAPAPIRSAVNIPFFVSRGYVVFLPDIHYRTGQPGRDAYNYVVSGTQALIKKGFIDSKRMAIQGHSWGGYQVAYIITKTNLYKAAWAGAPVANMTSAYGGIRWESGVSRQWQYEKTQSRLGVSLWQNRNLYIDNSPLFHLDKVTTPIVILHNDADGAVPWYQGIELFTGLRRLGKKVWMLNYNGQGHGLTQRQDMRDYQVRMQQFFDWQLKDSIPPRWLTEGVPAIRKGRDLGLD